MTENFSPSAKFSSLDISTQCKCVVTLTSLLSFDKAWLSGTSGDRMIDDAVNKLLKVLCNKITIDTVGDIMEYSVVRQLIKYIFAPVCTEVVIEKRHNWWIKEQSLSNVKVGYLGMGSRGETWYGQPDSRVRGSSTSYDTNIIALDDTEENDGMDGTTTNIEIKRSHSKLPQAIATTVVSSFTEKKLHPDLNSLANSIIINESCVIQNTFI